jgi:predicted nucleotidyltransferase
MAIRIPVPTEQVAGFCRRNHIQRFALFGSVLTSDFGPDSDIDVLVEFEPQHVPGLLGIARMERELSEIFGGRRVDLRTPEDLSRYFREEVMQQAEVQYAQAG